MTKCVDECESCSCGKQIECVIELSEESWTQLNEMLDNPPKATQALKDLMKTSYPPAPSLEEIIASVPKDFVTEEENWGPAVGLEVID